LIFKLVGFKKIKKGCDALTQYRSIWPDEVHTFELSRILNHKKKITSKTRWKEKDPERRQVPLSDWIVYPS
jgi:hypothetical protein